MPPDVRFPWDEAPLDDWNIVGMNHYYTHNVKHLFVAMTKDDIRIQAEGCSSAYVFDSLNKQVREKGVTTYI